MAARNKPAGIRSLVYGIDKSKVHIEGLSVSGLDQDEHNGLLGRFLAIADRKRLVAPRDFMADGRVARAHLGRYPLVGPAFHHNAQDQNPVQMEDDLL
jgi:hypothetical protein